MEIGKLNQRITILENTTHIDNKGNHKAQQDELFSCWACVSMRNSVNASTEQTKAGVTKEVQTLQFMIRQNSETLRISTNENCILFRGVIYNITGISPDFERRDYLKITAVARKVGDNVTIY
ncbi:MAG: phage head closure protein [Ruminococcus sp.]|nr:phage head closure protein [Ruminococcus sp.]